MDSAIAYIRQRNITDKFDVVRILMERAEQLSNDGDEKKKLVMEAYVKLNSEESAGRYKLIPLNSIELIIDALVYASKTAISINQSTGCFDKIKGWISKLMNKSSSTTTA
jgi:hypothetical protein